MFRKFWASNWPKVLFAQLVAVALMVDTFLISAYGLHVTGCLRVAGLSLGVSSFAFLLVCFIGIVKKNYGAIVFAQALGMVIMAALVAIALEPSYFSRNTTLAVVTALAVLAVAFTLRTADISTRYRLSEWPVRLSFWAECIVSLCLLTLLQPPLLLPASL